MGPVSQARFLIVLSIGSILLAPSLLGFPALLVNAKNTKDTAQRDVKAEFLVEVVDAWYENADNGSVPNDVQIIVHFKLFGAVTYNLIYYISLELPSGETYVYSVAITTKRHDFLLLNTFYNHATESGWYKAHIYGVLKTKGNYECTDQLPFDPPGSDNGDPKLYELTLL